MIAVSGLPAVEYSRSYECLPSATMMFSLPEIPGLFRSPEQR